MAFEGESSGVDLVALLKHLRQSEDIKYLVRGPCTSVTL